MNLKADRSQNTAGSSARIADLKGREVHPGLAQVLDALLERDVSGSVG